MSGRVKIDVTSYKEILMNFLESMLIAQYHVHWKISLILFFGLRKKNVSPVLENAKE